MKNRTLHRDIIAELFYVYEFKYLGRNNESISIDEPIK